MIQFLQVNVNRCRAAHSVLEQDEREYHTDITLMIEPNKKIAVRQDWITDDQIDVAIKINTQKHKVLSTGRNQGFAYVEFDKLVAYVSYASPNKNLEHLETLLNNLSQSMATHTKQIIISADLNAKAFAWESPIEDKRGKVVTEWLAQKDLIVINKGSRPTFVRGKSRSFIDITVASSRIAAQIGGWTVTQKENLSDHRTIIFNLEESGCNNTRQEIAEKRWLVNTKSIENFRTYIREIQNLEVTDAAHLTNVIQNACNLTLTPKPSRVNRKPMYWWNTEIHEARKKSIKCRRSLTRTRKKNDKTKLEEAENAYKVAKKELKHKICQAKERCWKTLIDDLDDNIWGQAYNIIKKKTTHKIPIHETIEHREAEKLFPNKPEVIWHREDMESIPLFSEEELVKAASKLKDKKAPGVDGIPNEAIKVVAKEAPALLLGIYNVLLQETEFPEIWKIAKLVLIEKPKKTPSDETSYRPICLLNGLGKLLEILLENRLRKEIETKGDLAENQYGFRKGRSTIDAIKNVADTMEDLNAVSYSCRKIAILITFDVKNAFNSASWVKIIAQLEQVWKTSPYLTNILKSYLSNRSTIVAGTPKKITCGIPQGSNLGPLLWNILYNPILKLQLPGGVKTIGYADDLALLVQSRTPQELKRITETCAERIVNWMESQDLEIAPHKTEAVLIAKRNKVNKLVIQIGGQNVETQNELKYLGMHIDSDFTMKSHVTNIVKKVKQVAKTLCWLIPNWAITRPSRRRLYVAVTDSIMLYGSNIWLKVMRYKKYRTLVNNARRPILIRACLGYQTISTEGLEVLSRSIPTDLLAEERSNTYQKNAEERKEEREHTISRWEKRWKESNKASWTRKMIRDLRTWIHREHGELSYYMTQVLSGHGNFGSYLYKLKIAESPLCQYCQEQEDSVEHTIFICGKWGKERKNAELILGPVAPDTIVDKMLESKENWNAANILFRDILSAKDHHRNAKKRTT